MPGRESVSVVVKSIRNTGALDDLWSVEGTREDVAEQVRAWSTRTDVAASGPDLVEVVLGLPPVPDDGPWLNAVGITAGPAWVWTTSRPATPPT